MKTKIASLALLLTLIFPIMAKSQVKIQQTAGRDALGEFAPEFARLNDDILFGEVWSRNNLLSRPFHRNRSGPDVAGTDRFLVQVPSRIGEEERSDPNRDSRNTHPCRILRGLAESVGGFPYGKRSLDRR